MVRLVELEEEEEVGERNEKEEGQRKRFAERREGMTHSVT